MNRITGNPEAVLDQQISGFHQYSLQHPVHLTYVSSNLCRMLGCSREELLNEYTDMYGQLVHPADRTVYDRALEQLAEDVQNLTVQYRIVLKNGEIRHISDDLTSFRMDDGTIAVSSVLTDITEMKAESDSLSILNETLPCGFLRYTCEKHPKVTYFNDEMLRILRFPEDEPEQLEMYKENVYMMIPPEQRRKFSVFLKRVYTHNAPVSGELVIQRFDGTRARIQGWVSKCTDAQGNVEFQTVCVDITENYKSRKAGETERYLNALTEVYDRIFQYDFGSKTAKCLHAENSGTFGRIINIPMHMEDATEHYLCQAVIEDDRDRMREYFRGLYSMEFMESGGQPPQIQFRALTSEGREQMCSGIFIKMDSSVGLFCCRTIDLPVDSSSAELEMEADSLRSENESLRSMVSRFTEGNAAFRVEGDIVKPLYHSDNICSFFGYSSEEWDGMAETGISIREFVSKSGVPYRKFMSVLEKGEAEFAYMDVDSQTPQKIKAVCTDMFSGGTASKYVMLYRVPEMTDAETSGNEEDAATENNEMDIQIRTFGYFDVFVDGTPIAFRNKKSKELFALLVDRRGGYVTSEEAISFLWEDEPVSAVTQARYRKVAMRLKNILEEYGIADIIETESGKRRIVTEKVKCDLYDYLSQKEEFAHLFKGSYLNNYSWGETTLGELYSE